MSSLSLLNLFRGKCKYAGKCNHYRDNSNCCNYSVENRYCGEFRWQENFETRIIDTIARNSYHIEDMFQN